MPTSNPANIFGRIVTRRDIELALVGFLRDWVPTYVAEIERQSGLPAKTVPLPPDQVKSYRGGLDYNTWEQSWSPIFIVTATPMGLPERKLGPGVYTQTFLVGVGCNFAATNLEQDLSEPGSDAAGIEDNARQYADMLGMAACAAILQHGQIGLWPDGTPISLKTTLLKYPELVFPRPADRRMVRSQFQVSLIADWVLQEAGGPTSPYEDPYVADQSWPNVQSVDAELNSVTLDA